MLRLVFSKCWRVALVGILVFSTSSCYNPLGDTKSKLACQNPRQNEDFSFVSKDWNPGEVRLIGFGVFSCNQDVKLESLGVAGPGGEFEIMSFLVTLGVDQEPVGFLNDVSQLREFSLVAEEFRAYTHVSKGQEVQIFGLTRSPLASGSGAVPVTDLIVSLRFGSVKDNESLEMQGKASIGIE